jgi:hypothetical protein
MFITREKALVIANKIISVHAPLILKELGLDQENDGILDRITAVYKEVTPKENYCGIFNYVVRKTTIGFFTDTYEYLEGTGSIEINMKAAFTTKTKEGVYKTFWPSQILGSDKKLKAWVLFALAHELRHYWQYVTGEIWSKSLQIDGVSLMPYAWRWEETDANEFASAYGKKVAKG